MGVLFEVGLANALMVVLLAIVATAATVWKRHPALVHGLWVLVFIKLLTPPLVAVPVPWLSDQLERRAANSVSEQAGKPLSGGEIASQTDLPHAGPDDAIASVDGSGTALAADSATGSQTTVGVGAPGGLAGTASDLPGLGAGNAPGGSGMFGEYLSIPGILVILWLAGSLGWFAVSAALTWRVRRLLAFSRPATDELHEEVQRLAQRMKLPGCPDVHVVSGRISPMVWPIGRRAKLLLPEGLIRQFSPEQRSAVLTHELAHVKRRDHWVRLLEHIGTGLYWWHPVVWWARAQLRRVEEECCDAWVVRIWPELARSYAAALLETIDYVSRSPERRLVFPPITSGTVTVRLLRSRLTKIYLPGTPARLGCKGWVALAIPALLLLPTVPGAATSAISTRRDTLPSIATRPAADRADEAVRPVQRSGIRAFDGFDGQLALDWTSVRLDPAHVSLEKRPGMLTLTTQAGDVYGDIHPLGKNLFVIDNPLPEDSDFVATTCLDSFQPTVHWQQAGLLVYNGDDSFLKWTSEFSSLGQRILTITREENGRPLAWRVYVDLDWDRIWLRLTKRGRLYEIASSTDGRTYAMHGEFLWGDGSPERIGLIAVNGPTADEVDAHFDFFEVRSLTPQEMDDRRAQERRKLQGTWESVSCRLGGKPMEKAPLSRLTFVDAILTITEEKQGSQAEYSLDIAKRPKRLLLWNNQDRTTVVRRLLYSLEGDTLVVCVNPSPESPAPTELNIDRGDGLALVTLKRVTAEWSNTAADLALAKNASPWSPQKQFEVLDGNEDSGLTIDEFTADRAWTKSIEQATEVFELSDRDRDGRLTLAEFTFRPRKAVYLSRDTDGDGVLSIKEFRQGEMAWASVARIRTIFALVDRNSDQKLSFEEFRRRPKEAWFGQLDLNEDECLTYDEFAAGNVALVRDGRCPLVFAPFDRNGDGSLSFDEYASRPAEADFHIKDVDADGRLGFREFGAWLSTPEKIAVGKRLFAEKDGDGDGFVSLEEYTDSGGQGA